MVATEYQERTVASGELKLAYQEWGDPGSPVILALHGFGVSGHMFDEFAERVKDRYHLIALDQRGHGDSDWAPDGDYSRDAFVGDLERVAEGLGLDRFILMGHSMGGLNAVEYTVRHPERVEALVLVDVGPEAAKEGVDNIVRFTRGPDELEFDEFVRRAMQFNPRRTEENIRERMRHRLRPSEGGKWTWKFDRRFREGNGAIKVGSELSNDEMWQRFRSVSVPVLIVRGLESDVLSQDVAQRAATEMRCARLIAVPGAGHSVPGDNPDAFTEAVAEFADDVRAGRFAQPASGDPPLNDLVETHRPWRPGASSAIVLAVAAGGIAAAVVAFSLLRGRRKRQRRRVARVIEQRPHLRRHGRRALRKAHGVRRAARVPDVHAPHVDRERVRATAGHAGEVGSAAVRRARTHALPAAAGAVGAAQDAWRSRRGRIARTVAKFVILAIVRGALSSRRQKKRRGFARWRS